VTYLICCLVYFSWCDSLRRETWHRHASSKTTSSPFRPSHWQRLHRLRHHDRQLNSIRQGATLALRRTAPSPMIYQRLWSLPPCWFCVPARDHAYSEVDECSHHVILTECWNSDEICNNINEAYSANVCIRRVCLNYCYLFIIYLVEIKLAFSWSLCYVYLGRVAHPYLT